VIVDAQTKETSVLLGRAKHFVGQAASKNSSRVAALTCGVALVAGQLQDSRQRQP